MPPADATDTASGSHPAAGRRAEPTRRDSLDRIEDALGRIAAALARRVEREAERRDREAVAPLPVDELRDRLDRVILRLRAAIEEAES